MNKFYISLILISLNYLTHSDIHESHLCVKKSPPAFQEPVILFKDRPLFAKLKIKEQLQEAKIPLSEEQIKMLFSLITGKEIKKIIGRQIPEIGHDPERRVIYDAGILTNPTHIVLTFSGQETLQRTIESLNERGYAHNFIIGIDGKIYPVTKENESLEEALLHRPFAVGVTGKIIDGKYEQRDMNSVSITISVVGKNTLPITNEQEDALIQLVTWLSKKFEIKPYNVVDYGTIALPYGRREVQENLPWESLAKKRLAIWPSIPTMSKETANTLIFLYPNITTKIACAFRKIGFLCPIVTNQENEEFKTVTKTFQKHYKCLTQDGTITLETFDKLTDIIRQTEELNPELKNIYPTAEAMLLKNLK